MRISISRTAEKFLESAETKHKNQIRTKIIQLLEFIEKDNKIPVDKFDIKALKGKWKPHLRLRIGKIRIIFKVDFKDEILEIKEIDFRGDIY